MNEFALDSANNTFITGSAPNDWIGRPVLLDDGTKWIMLYRVGTDHGSGSVGLNLRFSTNEGATWTADNTFTDGEACVGVPFVHHVADSNTNVSEGELIQCPNGDLLVHTLEQATGGTYQYRSTDGGKTWTDEGRVGNSRKIYIGQQYIVIGTTIYGIGRYYPSNYGAGIVQVAFYKSTDNGANWTYVIVDANDQMATELSLCNPSGNILHVFSRDNAQAVTYQYTSTDLGATWSARSGAPAILGVIQRPRTKILLGGIVLFGREYLSASEMYTVVWYSPDGGATWIDKFRPDATLRVDNGYCSLLQRVDGSLYMLSYYGATTSASIQELIFHE